MDIFWGVEKRRKKVKVFPTCAWWLVVAGCEAEFVPPKVKTKRERGEPTSIRRLLPVCVCVCVCECLNKSF